MEDLLVNVKVPSIQENYDIFVPSDLRIARLTEVLSEGVRELTNGRYQRSGKEMLMLLDPDTLLDPEKTLPDYQVENGAQLMLL